MLNRFLLMFKCCVSSAKEKVSDIIQAEFKEINLSAHSNGGIRIEIDTYRNGMHIIRQDNNKNKREEFYYGI